LQRTIAKRRHLGVFTFLLTHCLKIRTIFPLKDECANTNPPSTLILDNSTGHIGSAQGEAAFLANITTGSANDRINQSSPKVRHNLFQKAGENNPISSPGSGSHASNSTEPGVDTNANAPHIGYFHAEDLDGALNSIHGVVSNSTFDLKHSVENRGSKNLIIEFFP
jgi:hypothetical protein